MKKRVFAIVPTVILCILLFYLIKTSQSPKSPYQNLTPVSGFSIQAVQAQYTIDTTRRPERHPPATACPQGSWGKRSNQSASLLNPFLRRNAPSIG